MKLQNTHYICLPHIPLHYELCLKYPPESNSLLFGVWEKILTGGIANTCATNTNSHSRGGGTDLVFTHTNTGIKEIHQPD